MWQLCNAIMASFFAMAAYVQHNDPDWTYWMSLYAFVSFICVGQTLSPSAFGYMRFWRVLLRSAAIIYAFVEVHCIILYASHVFASIQSASNSTTIAEPTSDQLATPPYGLLESEPGREALGVLIIIIWISVSTKVNQDLLVKQAELRKNRALHGIEMLDRIESLRLKEKIFIFLFSIVPITLWAYHLAKGLHLC